MVVMINGNKILSDASNFVDTERSQHKPLPLSTMRKKYVVKFFTLLFLLYAFSTAVSAQSPAPRILPAKRTTQTVKIDGLLNDSAWKDAAIMTGLIEFRPKIGDKENYATRTESWLMYDDKGIYFGGYCH